MFAIIILGAAILTGAAAWKSLKGANNPAATALPGAQGGQYLGSHYVQPSPMPAFVPPSGIGMAVASDGLNVGLGAGESFANSSAQSGSAIAGDFAKAIPFVGAALSAVAGFLLAGHQRRLQQATSENSAVNNYIAEMDQNIAAIANAYNSKQISAQQAAAYYSYMLTAYWQEVTPHIQPGRNGCAGGANCTAHTCSGSYGAACCNGCGPIKLSLSNLAAAVLKSANTSGVVTADVRPIFGSKYGGRARAEYSVSFQR